MLVEEYPPSPVVPEISVIICTYNRAAMLGHALESLCNQSLDSGSYEIVVVDNNSKDHTRSVVEGFRLRHPGLRYSFEGNQGLSHARNHGWQKARGRYVAYIDDDCELPVEWLTVAQEIITRFAPAAFGGPVRSIRSPSTPRWFKDYEPNAIAEARFLRPVEAGRIVGMNMFFRHDLMAVVGGFDPTLGMRGEEVAYGEETAFLNAVAKHFPDELYFDPRLYVYDVIRPEKTKLGYILRASFAGGRSNRRLNPNGKNRLGRGGLSVKSLRVGARFFLELLYTLAYRDRNKYPFIENFIQERGGHLMRELGDIYEQLCESFEAGPSPRR